MRRDRAEHLIILEKSGMRQGNCVGVYLVNNLRITCRGTVVWHIEIYNLIHSLPSVIYFYLLQGRVVQSPIKQTRAD